METIYTPKEVAEYLKVNTITVLRHLRTGELKSYKIGRLWRVSENQLHEAMKRWSNG